MKRCLFFLILLGFGLGCAADQKIRYVAARWVTDQDREPIEQPKGREEYNISDALDYQFFYQLERATNLSLRGEQGLHSLGMNTLQEALNTNNFDEVADSSWFTNRLGRYRLTGEELRRGPNRSTGPDPQGPWTVLSAKTVGVSPGFLIADQRGDKYFIKFDPPGHPELITAPEMIGTKIMYAVGYNVPETYLITFHPQILKLSPEATTKTRYGKKVPFTEADLADLFRRVPEQGKGYYRSLASKFIEGKPLGPFSLRGRDRDDENDRIPHEHRRELRGYRVVASLLNNTDTKESNTLDTFIVTGPAKQGYLRHYLLDFGNSLGSVGIGPKDKVHYEDYYFNLRKVSGSFLSLGTYQPDWDKIEDPNLESVGIFESTHFHPEKWRPAYPNPAFQNMTERDAFWAAKILMRLTNEDIQGIVEEGKYSDPQATAYVTKTLIERRDKIGRYWFQKVNPLDNFEWNQSGQDAQLHFDDLMITTGLDSPGSAVYRYRLIQSRNAYQLLPWTEFFEPAVSFSGETLQKLKPGKMYLVQIQTRRSGQAYWGPTVDVIVQRSEKVKILGLNRRYGD